MPEGLLIFFSQKKLRFYSTTVRTTINLSTKKKGEIPYVQTYPFRCVSKAGAVIENHTVLRSALLFLPIKHQTEQESAMGYKKATQILPEELLHQIQEYVDGEYLYIPRTADNRKSWGTATSTRQELITRNRQIFSEYLAGESMEALAGKYFLSLKSIQRIVGQQKKENA